jgi:hypothetical protein
MPLSSCALVLLLEAIVDDCSFDDPLFLGDVVVFNCSDEDTLVGRFVLLLGEEFDGCGFDDLLSFADGGATRRFGLLSEVEFDGSGFDDPPPLEDETR